MYQEWSFKWIKDFVLVTTKQMIIILLIMLCGNIIGSDPSKAKNVTFLAGEIVKDNNINIYDLSAVVSYFGTNNTVDASSQYAKYDLNRDGKIDSKDVAYVLVSWGK